MSLIVTLYVREGIVMASDSRLTLNRTENQEEGKPTLHIAVGQSDSTYKTFLAPNNIGISTSGDASIGGVPIAGYIESFITEKLPEPSVDIDEIPQRLRDHFSKLPGPPNVTFHVGGYKKNAAERIQRVWRLGGKDPVIELVNKEGVQGATWSGEADILTRLLTRVASLDEKGGIKQVMPFYPVPWNFLTLQDAIDFAVYAIKSTADSIRFFPRAKTVGGPIDVLVIKPEEAFWVRKKKLRVDLEE